MDRHSDASWTSPDDRVTIAHVEIDDRQRDNASKQVKKRDFVIAPNLVFEGTRTMKLTFHYWYIIGSVFFQSYDASFTLHANYSKADHCHSRSNSTCHLSFSSSLHKSFPITGELHQQSLNEKTSNITRLLCSFLRQEKTQSSFRPEGRQSFPLRAVPDVTSYRECNFLGIVCIFHALNPFSPTNSRHFLSQLHIER